MMYFDDLLTDYIGEFGRYQVYIFCLVSLIGFPAAFNTMGIVFIAGVPEHWCAVPELEHMKENSSITYSMIKNLTIPQDSNGYSSCTMYDQNYTGWAFDDVVKELQGGKTNLSAIKCQNGWIYSEEVYTSTVTSQWNLVCDDDALRATTSSVYMAGLMAGVLVTGNLSDIFGRKPMFAVCLVLVIALSIGVSFSPNVIVFCVLRFLVGFANIGLFTTVFVIAMEIVGKSWRVHAGIAYEYFWALGYMFYALYAYYIRDWKILQIATSSSCAVLLILIFIVPESPRWLYSRGKQEKGDVIVTKIAKWNKKGLPEPLDITVKSSKRGYMWDLVRTPRMRCRTFNSMFNWFVNSFVYYGLSLNTSNLGGNDFINFFISGGVEIPAYMFCQVSLTYLGRRWPLAGTMIIGGVALLLVIPIPQHLNAIAVTFAMIGKFCISASFAIIYVLTAEMYPTVTRQIGVATGSFAARIGGIVAPYVGLLDKFGAWIPMTIFGVTSVAAGLLALQFPETKDKKLPETVEEGEAFGLKDYHKDKPTVEVVDPGEIESKTNYSSYIAPDSGVGVENKAFEEHDKTAEKTRL